MVQNVGEKPEMVKIHLLWTSNLAVWQFSSFSSFFFKEFITKSKKKFHTYLFPKPAYSPPGYPFLD